MKRVGTLLLAVIFVLAQGGSAVVRAEALVQPSVVINELQTNGAGTGTTLEEFIELKNITNSAVDISSWKLEYVNSANKTTELFVFASETIVQPGGYILLAPTGAPVAFLSEKSPKLAYAEPSSGMAATSGVLKLLNNLSIVVDVIAWTSTSSKATPDIIFYSGDGKSIQRKVVNEATAATGVPADDFEKLIIPTPETINEVPGDVAIDPEDDLPPTPEPPVEQPPENDSEEHPPEEAPEPAPEETPPPQAYAPVLLNELYVDPVSPEPMQAMNGRNCIILTTLK